MADEETPKKKWTLWGEKKPKKKSPLELRQEALAALARDTQRRFQAEDHLRGMRPPASTNWTNTRAMHNPMDAMCLMNQGRQSASSARCAVCRPRFR
jgi:hypothetical protein